MANRFGTDIIVQTPDPAAAAQFYVRALGFAITDQTPTLVSLHGDHINLFIERGNDGLGPVLEVLVDDLAAAKARVIAGGGQVVKDEPEFPRCYVRDPLGLVYNLAPRR